MFIENSVVQFIMIILKAPEDTHGHLAHVAMCLGNFPSPVGVTHVASFVFLSYILPQDVKVSPLQSESRVCNRSSTATILAHRVHTPSGGL